MQFDHIDDLQQALAQHNYIADRSLTTALFFALKFHKPIFLEGEAGVGKTEIAKTLTTILGTELIRLQCYEGLDASTAIYEWNYPRQLLQIRMAETQGSDKAANIFTREFLIQRPLLHAIDGGHTQAPVLLIDELDRADEEFEAFLLELLSDWQITIPELVTIKAKYPPIVLIHPHSYPVSPRRSSAALSCSTGSITPPSPKSCRFWQPACPTSTKPWRVRLLSLCKSYGASICSKSPV